MATFETETNKESEEPVELSEPAEGLDKALVNRAEKHIKQYPGDTEVADAYKAYRAAENAVMEENLLASDNLMETLDKMEKHYALKAYVDGFVQQATPIVASLIKSAERFELLKIKRENLRVQQELPGSSKVMKRAVGELTDAIDNEADRYTRLRAKYDDLYNDIMEREGVDDDEQLLGVINGVSAKILPLETETEYTDSEPNRMDTEVGESAGPSEDISDVPSS